MKTTDTTNQDFDAKKELKTYFNQKSYLNAVRKCAISDSDAESEEEIAKLSEALSLLKKRISEKLIKLDWPYNEVLYKKFIRFYPVAEIACEMNFSEEYVRRLIRKAIALYSKL